MDLDERVVREWDGVGPGGGGWGGEDGTSVNEQAVLTEHN